MINKKNDVNKQNLALEMKRICDELGFSNENEALFFPKYFQIETTRLCNARCPYCAYDQWDKSTPFMPDELFNKIVSELSNYADWINWVCLSRAGEPLLDKKITTRVHQLKKAGIKKVILVTNGSLLNSKKIENLLEAGIDEIMFSVDSIEKTDYEKIKKGLNFDIVLNNIKTFFKLRNQKQPNVNIRIRSVANFDLKKPEGKERLKKWEEFWNNYKKPNDRIYMKKPHNWGNQKEVKWSAKKEVYHPCILPWSTFHITTMGKATFCPVDYDATMNLADINNTSIKESWNGAKMEEIRNLHRNGNRNKVEFCRGCKVFDKDASLEHN